MKNLQTHIPGFPVVAIVALAMVFWSITPVDPVHAAGDPIVVIVNNANPVDNLSLGELKKLFLENVQPLGHGKSRGPRNARPGCTRTNVVSEDRLRNERCRSRQVFPASGVHRKVRHATERSRQRGGRKELCRWLTWRHRLRQGQRSIRRRYDGQSSEDRHRSQRSWLQDQDVEVHAPVQNSGRRSRCN